MRGNVIQFSWASWLSLVAALAGCASSARLDTVDAAASAFETTPECAGQLKIGEVPAEPAQAAALDCAGDSGPCTTGDGMCEGSADARVCDPARYVVTPSAAICMARAHGLEPGLSAPTAELIYNFDYRRAIWAVRNVLEDNSREDFTDRTGQIFAVDAVTGAVLDTLFWREIS